MVADSPPGQVQLAVSLRLQTTNPRGFRLIAFLGLAGIGCLPTEADELNVWPLVVVQTAGAATPSWQGGGPLFFGWQSADGRGAGGFRPFYVYQQDATKRTTESDFLYPLLTHRATETDRRWSLLSLVNAAGPNDPRAAGVRHFDVWPVYFSRTTGDAATSYHAVFPLGGTVLNRFGDDRISWTLFPLYGRFERHQVTTITAPWPFLKVLHGDGNHGFAFWPVFGWRAKAGAYRERFFLWPLIYRNEAKLWAPIPDVSEGVLPFYARDQGAGFRSETYLWPLFGYTHRQAPYRYDETRWFWPLLVQGRGDDRHINRWAPFYTHSVIKGNDKRWVLWPLFREERWTAAGLAQTKTQLLYFLYWSLQERSAANPALAPAERTHLWPLLSYWDNGAGHRQLQVLSPFEVFFPYNEPVRLAYSPLFALYRYDRRAPGEVRWSFLWDAVTWRQAPAQREFHLGPLFSVARGPDRGRIALGCGLIGLKRGPAGSAWKPFLFDFLSPPDKKTSPAATP
jgi:hypothetical protein